MANVSRVQGGVPVGTLGAANWNGKVGTYVILVGDATACHIGDFVKLSGSSGTSGLALVDGVDTEGMPAVVKATASDTTLVGAVMGFSANPANLNIDGLYRAASTARLAFVSDDPNTIYEMQEDSVGNNIDADMVGLSTDIITGTGSNTTGISGQMLDSSDTATAGGQMRILGLSRRAGNSIGADAKWLVKINVAEGAYLATTDI